VLAHFAHHLLTALPIPLLPLIRDNFKLDHAQSGLVVSAFSLAYGIAQLPAGWFADRIGTRVLITVGICGVAVAGLAVGLSQSFVMVIVFLALVGVAGGGYHPSAAPLISASVESKNRGRALGIHQMGGSASLFLAPLAATAIASAWGWRVSFIGLAVPVAMFGIIFYVLLGQKGLKAEMNKPVRTIAGRQEETPSPPSRWRRLVFFLIMGLFTQIVIFSTIAFIPLFIVDNFGISKETAGALLSLVYSAGLWAGPLGGYLSDRFGTVPVVLVACLTTGPLIYLLNLVPYGLGFGALLLIIGACLFTCMPALESYIVRQAPEHRRSTVLGMYYFTGMETGAILTPALGFLIDQFGYSFTFNITGVAVIGVTVICAVFLYSSRD